MINQAIVIHIKLVTMQWLLEVLGSTLLPGVFWNDFSG